VYDAGTTASSTAQGQFGFSTSISADGTVYVVGAPNATSTGVSATGTAGLARVYRYLNGSWVSQNLNPGTEPANGDKYGSSVAISPDGTWIVVGAPGAFGASVSPAANDGVVYIFKYINNLWVPYNSKKGIAESFGTSVAITNNGQVAVGGPTKATTNTGQVSVFNISNGPFVAVGSVQSGSATNDNFGKSVAFDASGTILAVGATQTSGTGYVKVYRLIADAWTADTTTAVVGSAAELFGTSISLNSAGNILAVGAPVSSSTPGYVKTFTSSGTTWSVSGVTIIATGTDRFGTSVSLDPTGTILAVGSPNVGYVRVYKSTSPGVFPTYANYSNIFTDPATNINFGQSVAISQNLAIGAPALNNSATPVNYAKIYSQIASSSVTKGWVEQGGETATTTTGPLSSLNIDLNGQSRFFPQVGKYFNQYQPLKYHSGSPYPGIYSYSFALKPELAQPSGTCNFSRIDNSQINITLKSSMYSPCNLKLFAVNYNILRFRSGMAGLAFTN
jgi:hypothetical protein